MQSPSVAIERFGIDDITPQILSALESLYQNAYHNSHMFGDLLSDISESPEVFQLFIAKSHFDHSIVGARVVETKPQPDVDYFGLPPVHGKRFTVLPSQRSQGTGKLLLEASKAYCFDELGLSAMFGRSNEVGALAMYGREGALYLRSSIEEALRRNSPEQNLALFAEFLTNLELRPLRYPEGEGIVFVYPKDAEASKFFREHGYISMPELLKQYHRA